MSLSFRITGFALAAALPLLAAPALADKIKNPTAVFSGLDKITGRIISFEAAVDETVQFGSLQLTARVCYSRPEYENPQTTSFVEVDEVGFDNSYKRLFTGWMFASSPGLNAIEHPVYDIWLSECKGGKDIIKTPPEVEDEPPPPAPADLRRNPRPAQPLPGTRPPGPGGATSPPLRLPGAPGAPPGAVLPPGNVAQPPRPAPQQRFFPTNPGMGGMRDPASQGR
ncbi:DUF2155 domain-containing protein [Rhabdaerophilum sp.]|uniref:DUF2155 domain-containing protein n=1 Tax=Rhabdaerophilum sp. TaxID=2717341 RepID=UPI0038D427EE